MENQYIPQAKTPVRIISPYQPIEEAVIVESTYNNNQGAGRLKPLSGKTAPFIEANTTAVSLQELERDFIPVFAKDNESSISHQEFIETVYHAISAVFPRETISEIELRVSHKICGRIPSAVGKPANLLEEWEKTQYYERMAFCIEIQSIRDIISGNELVLSIAGVRAYNHTNLYGKKGLETFKLAIGFINRVCTNLCISSQDGLASEMRVTTTQELYIKSVELLQSYQAQHHLDSLKVLPSLTLSDTQFATLLGRTRLYQFLPKENQKELPMLAFGDSQLNMLAKDYYKDKRFCKSEEGYLNLWNLYNLFTNANRSSSYIDTFLDRGANAYDFITGIASALNGENTYKWFIE
ncbi:DUF3871 family protein [Paludibacteraceae bacterium OttesenSCG-928-F17]|nr:DUF3871 family protein [Paludibacteraceae bacterium OttesenSCG-928-F17]